MIDPRAQGDDFSKWQLEMRIVDNPPRPIDFVFQRTSYGAIKDQRFEQIYHSYTQYKPRVGFYHYYSTAVPAIQQAELMIEIIGDKPCQMIVVDYEKNYNKLDGKSYLGLITMFEKLEAKYPDKRILLYHNRDIWDNYLEPYGSWHRDKNSFLAAYNYWPSLNKKPNLPSKNYPGYTFWQYEICGKYYSKQDGRNYGSATIGLDLDVYKGTLEELDVWLGVVPPVVPDCEKEVIRLKAEMANVKAITDGWDL